VFGGVGALRIDADVLIPSIVVREFSYGEEKYAQKNAPVFEDFESSVHTITSSGLYRIASPHPCFPISNPMLSCPE